MMILINSIFVILISLFVVHKILCQVAQDNKVTLHKLSEKYSKLFREIFISLYVNSPFIYYLLLFCTILCAIGIIGFIFGLLYIIIF